MSDGEIMVMIVSGIAALIGAHVTHISSLPSLYTKRNPGIGLTRLAVLCSVAWTAYVIQYHGDPSIEGIYVFFYLLMAYGATKAFGQGISRFYGVSLRVDVYEHNNFAAALFIAAFTLATGIVFGGSLWGEADPLSDAEGGWWIPVGFFMMGWISLAVATGLYLWREPGSFRQQVCQDRDAALSGSAAVYVLSTSTVLLKGVSGDFWGWRHGMFGMGAIALMLVGHEIVALAGGARPSFGWRVFEQVMYVFLAALSWFLLWQFDQWYIGV